MGSNLTPPARSVTTLVGLAVIKTVLAIGQGPSGPKGDVGPPFAAPGAAGHVLTSAGAGGMLASSKFVIDPATGNAALTPAWNSAGTVYTGLLVNATNTASAAGSMLADLQADGVSKFSVRKDGFVAWGNGAAFPALKRNGAGLDVRLADDSGYAAARVSYLQLATGSTISSSVDGAFNLLNSTFNDFSGLNFGGTTGAFPSLRRAGSGLELISADGLAFTNFQAGGLATAGDTNNILRIGRYSPGIPNALIYAGSVAQPASSLQFRGASGAIWTEIGPSGMSLGATLGTSPQALYLFNNCVDASNREFAAFKWSADVLHLNAEAAGTGIVRNLALQSGAGTVSIGAETANGYRLFVNGPVYAAGDVLSNGTFRSAGSNPGLILDSVGGSVYTSIRFAMDGGAGITLTGYANNTLYASAAVFEFSPTSVFRVNSSGYNPIIQVPYVANIVDYLNFAGGIVGSNATTISALGSDANISIRLTPKGTGAVVVPYVETAPLAFAALVAPDASNKGRRAWVADAAQTFTAANFGVIVTGGGANGVPVISDGTNWRMGG